MMLMSVALVLAAHARLHAQFDPEEWPDTADEDALVHFVSTDASFVPLGDNWTESLMILSGGDQETLDIDIGGFTGKKVLGNYLNIADSLYEDWADQEVIDILVQVYGDSAVLAPDGNPRNFNFLRGRFPSSTFPWAAPSRWSAGTGNGTGSSSESTPGSAGATAVDSSGRFPPTPRAGPRSPASTAARSASRAFRGSS
jgi:hypothetical protein